MRCTRFASVSENPSYPTKPHEQRREQTCIRRRSPVHAGALPSKSALDSRGALRFDRSLLTLNTFINQNFPLRRLDRVAGTPLSLVAGLVY